ncbi:hypothetical protein, partial [Mycolicibacterium insubricum]|uniref:hypothetical protein n=1 Tax=Mycolicibacterium insubricum TaxID=444597 RepID=UPI0021F387DE
MPQHTVVQLESLVVAGESDADAGRAASRSTVMPDMPIRPVTPSQASGAVTASSTISQCGRGRSVPRAIGEGIDTGLAVLGGLHGPRLLWCSSASSSSSSSPGEAN